MIRKLFHRVTNLLSSPAAYPVFLLALCAIAYTPLITRLGFYWDDFPINWIATTMGGDGLARYFSTNRPVWGLIYRATTPILGSAPLTWQIFAIIMRWVTGLALWLLLRLVWQKRERFAAWCAALFVIYPGFSQQFIAFMYSHFYIVLTCFLASMILMVLSLRFPRWYWPITIAAGLVGLLNLLAMEYFFLLDMLRPAFLWILFSENTPDWRKRLGRTLLAWLPYLIIFTGAIYWRSILFGFQTYQPALLSRMKAQPIPALLNLLPVMAGDIWKTGAAAWAKAFSIPTALQVGAANLRRYWLFVSAGAVVSAGFLLFFRPAEPGKKTTWALQPVVIGLLALVIAGGPFWLTDLQIGLVFPNDRFTLPFIFGACLVLAGLLAMVPGPRWTMPVLLSLLLGFSAGLHYQSAIVYNRDWSVQRSLFWQMVWRMPDLKAGTILLSNELPVTHYTDNSLSAPLNWIYDPKNDEQMMKYMLFYPTLRQDETLKNLQPHQSIEHNYLATTFHGSTDQMVTIYYLPPGCLRVLDPQVEDANWSVPQYLKNTLPLSSTTPILAVPLAGKPQPRPPAGIFGDEISHGWCYDYEKADLARQTGDWETIAKIGDEAFARKDYPNDPVERFPFIEGYAHVGRWSRALELSQEVVTITPVTKTMLCNLWRRIEQQTQSSAEQQEALNSVRQMAQCGSQ